MQGGASWIMHSCGLIMPTLSWQHSKHITAALLAALGTLHPAVMLAFINMIKPCSHHVPAITNPCFPHGI